MVSKLLGISPCLGSLKSSGFNDLSPEAKASAPKCVLLLHYLTKLVFLGIVSS
jgi:hypothetical protein